MRIGETAAQASEKYRWAEAFRTNHKCETCPFIKNYDDIGVGIIYVCDHVCWMPIDEILEYMEG